MARKSTKNKGGAPKTIPQVSAPQIILMALKKLVNAPFDILLEYGKISNQLSAPTARTAIHRL